MLLFSPRLAYYYVKCTFAIQAPASPALLEQAMEVKEASVGDKLVGTPCTARI